MSPKFNVSSVIFSSRLSWVNSESGQGFSLEYPHISMHAVSKDPAAFPQECLYLMLDTKLEDPGNYLATFLLIQ